MKFRDAKTGRFISKFDGPVTFYDSNNQPTVTYANCESILFMQELAGKLTKRTLNSKKFKKSIMTVNLDKNFR